jgi:hypothetical protein
LPVPAERPEVTLKQEPQGPALPEAPTVLLEPLALPPPSHLEPMPLSAPVTPGVIVPMQPSEPAAFGKALTQRVRLAGLVVPLWSSLLPFAALLALGVGVGVVVAPGRAESAAPPSALSPTASSSPPVTSGRAPESESPALAGRADVRALEGKLPSTLTSREALELDAAVSERELEGAKALRRRLREDPAIVKDKAVLGELRKLVSDPDSAREALAAMAELPGPTSPDLLYEVWTSTAGRTQATDLARLLVYSTDIRSKASAELSVALDLRLAETCEQNQAILTRAVEHGDKRSFHLLAKLKRKQGCGPTKRQDCYSCLREGTELDAAIKAVKSRRAPTPFSP